MRQLRRWIATQLEQPRALALRHRYARPLSFLQARLSPGSYLGLQLTLGVAVLMGASWLFGRIAEDVVTGDPLTVLDVQFSQWLHIRADPTLTRIMLAVSHTHDPWVLSAVVLGLSLVLLYRRNWVWLFSLLLAVPGGMLLNIVLKLSFQRARPTFDEPLLSLVTYSFPSGHAVAATVFYGVIATMLVIRTRGWPLRLFIVAVALTMIALVAFSRVYLGVHYLSDVLGGFAVAVAWLTLCVVGIHTWFQHRQARRMARQVAG
ncbi:MAG TPA: phosphatase PAP2 family protein [Polaromonas sp.]|uniref:phosphatase PAP2 family protein n=1 Tax=Polaromonas sp. TaxID=1869339 RepID=UPI002D47697D|nr:phosphatase PAP2 family protein [Polaromonas sp.]HYW56630.1 phosphatase PAP2 family protein [Polaromonas sp.]